MQLLLPPQVAKRLQRELRRAGSREIGGLLLGEHVGDERFRIVEISVQRSGGTHAGFMRDPQRHERQLKRFFRRTGEDYTRFNYLGEWHSHPRFPVTPSATDLEMMQSIVEDPTVGVNFLVLLVCNRAADRALEATALAFRAATEPQAVHLTLEEESTDQSPTLLQRCRRFLGF
jgi:integrative and conjugative element protein (TIGR02256 family)